MEAVGCKYYGCEEFIEADKKSEEKESETKKYEYDIGGIMENNIYNT